MATTNKQRTYYDALAEAFVAEGVDTQFALMGDGNMHWSTALAALPGIETIHVRHEHCAVAAAMAYHLATGKVAAGGALVGGVLGSRALIRATAAGTVPKGMLRKGAVKASQVLKRAGKSPVVAVGSVIAAGGVSKAIAKRAQARSADKRLAKRQADA